MSNPGSAAGIVMDHVNIVVTSMERSVSFYAEVLGLQRGFSGLLKGDWIDNVTGLKDAEAFCVFMESPGAAVRLELLEYRQPVSEPLPGASRPAAAGVRHVAFLVPDLDLFCQHAQTLGVRFVSGPVEVPFPLPGGRRKRLCYFHDPDGVILEAAEYSSAES